MESAISLQLTRFVKGKSKTAIVTIGIDLAKNVFAVHGVDVTGKPACALANKLARICCATLRDHAPFDEAARLSRRAGRKSFAIPA